MIVSLYNPEFLNGQIEVGERGESNSWSENNRFSKVKIKDDSIFFFSFFSLNPGSMREIYYRNGNEVFQIFFKQSEELTAGMIGQLIPLSLFFFLAIFFSLSQE